ncbi:hypothetical protein TSAR_010168 [Trichomalopsis sarcophagae]|uniref:SWIM-type domain-containing protein n=1 Tax=Trichomalopsis sarcophagae TaxID=543379 RepID=A0A232ED30_9HYME|nr:hypothetical protein TSAR_010168 [Trichomalopsis sarcophagae]
MDVVIKTGFETILHDIVFQPETVPKGKALVAANHVHNVEEHRKNGVSYLIQAQVIRQASVTSTPYSTQLNIDADRKIINVSCTCVYNKSGKCKHISALIYYVNNTDSLSKTDCEQQWGKPTTRQLVQEKYSKGRYFWEMFPPKEKLAVSDRQMELDISALTDPSPLKTLLLESKKNKNDKEIKNLMDSMLKQVDVILQKEECTKYLNIIFAFCEKKEVYAKNQIVTKDAYDYYQENIAMSRKNIIKLCSDTIDQANNEKWFDARSLRVSASKNVHEIKVRKTKTVESLVSQMLFPKTVKTAALSYGKENEVNAAKKYEKVYGVKVTKIGVLVSEKQPWLCASLDGIVIENGNIVKAVEFKCPSSCEKIPVVDFNQKKCNVNYLKFNEENVILKESAIYYTQCQVQLYVTGLNECDLFIYSPVQNGCVCIPVQRNDKFLKKVIEKCEDFYFKDYLPELYKKNKKHEVLCKAKLKAKGAVFTGLDITNINRN